MQLVTKPLAAQVLDVLRERIVRGAILPNTRVDMEALAAEFGISVTPVRDAVRLLEKDGLVVVRPRKGVFTAPADVKAFRDVFDARIALECLAVETAVDHIPTIELDALAESYNAAAERLRRAPRALRLEDEILGPIDSTIHELIVHYCDNEVVKELMDGLRYRIAWVRHLTADRGGRYQQSFVEHRQLLAALQARNRARAAALLRAHLTRSRDHTLAIMNAGPVGSSGDVGASPGRVAPETLAGGPAIEEGTRLARAARRERRQA